MTELQQLAMPGMRRSRKHEPTSLHFSNPLLTEPRSGPIWTTDPRGWGAEGRGARGEAKQGRQRKASHLEVQCADFAKSSVVNLN